MAWTDLGQPASAPDPPSEGGIGDVGGFWTVSADGKFVIAGFGWGAYPGDTIRTYNADFSYSGAGVPGNADSDSGAAYPAGPLVIDAAGNFYYLWRHTIFTPDATTVWDVMQGSGSSISHLWTNLDFGSNFLRNGAMDQAGTTFYVTTDNRGGVGSGGGDEKVYAINIATGAVTTFKTSSVPGAGYALGLPLVLSDDSIIIPWGLRSAELYPKRYDSSGTLLNTYNALPNWELVAATTGIALAYTNAVGPAPIDSGSFYIGYYAYSGGAPVPGNGVNIIKVNVATGAVIGDVFQTPSDGFEYDSPFTALNTAIDGTGFPVNTLCISGYGDAGTYKFWFDAAVVPPTPTVPPAPQVLTTQPCCGDSPSSSSTPGAGPVEEGTGWSPECNYGGTVPSAADIVDSESWAA